jgi:hypothetical protein
MAFYKETPSVLQQPQQKAGKGKSMDDEGEKKELEHDTVDLLGAGYATRNLYNGLCTGCRGPRG